MIIQRLHLNVARGFGNVTRVNELLTAEFSRLGAKGRVLTPLDAPWNTIVIEFEWENQSERERFYSDYQSTQEFQDFFTQFNELIEAGGTHETWNVASSF